MTRLSSITGDEAVTPGQQTVLRCFQAAINQSGSCANVYVPASAQRGWRLTGDAQAADKDQTPGGCCNHAYQ